MAVAMPSNYTGRDPRIVPQVPRDPMYVDCYVRRGESLRTAIQRRLRPGVTVRLRCGDDGRAYAAIRFASFEGGPLASRIRLPGAVDRAVQARGPSGAYPKGLRFTLAIPQAYLFAVEGGWL